jgi:hypothetical protein
MSNSPSPHLKLQSIAKASTPAMTTTSTANAAAPGMFSLSLKHFVLLYSLEYAAKATPLSTASSPRTKLPSATTPKADTTTTTALKTTATGGMFSFH